MKKLLLLLILPFALACSDDKEEEKITSPIDGYWINDKMAIVCVAFINGMEYRATYYDITDRVDRKDPTKFKIEGDMFYGEWLDIDYQSHDVKYKYKLTKDSLYFYYEEIGDLMPKNDYIFRRSTKKEYDRWTAD